MTKDKRRDELLEKLDEVCTSSIEWTDDGPYVNTDDVADFILAREKKMLEEIEKPLARIKEENEPHWKVACEYMPTLQTIDDALATINKYKGE